MRMTIFRPQHRPRPRARRLTVILTTPFVAPAAAVKDPIMMIGVTPAPR